MAERALLAVFCDFGNILWLLWSEHAILSRGGPTEGRTGFAYDRQRFARASAADKRIGVDPRRRHRVGRRERLWAAGLGRSIYLRRARRARHRVDRARPPLVSTRAALAVDLHRLRPASSSSLGGAARQHYEVLGDLSSHRSLVPDLITLPGYLVLAAALGGFAWARRRGRTGDFDATLDATVAAVAAFSLAWIALVDPVVASVATPLPVKGVMACYPALSVFLVALAARIAFSPEWSARRRVPAAVRRAGLHARGRLRVHARRDGSAGASARGDRRPATRWHTSALPQECSIPP